MGTYVLTTCGTSLLTGLRRSLGLQPPALPPLPQTIPALRQLEPTDRACGAEINSLFHLLGQRLSNGVVAAPLRVHLLVSETPDGDWTGRALTSYLQKRPEVAGVSHAAVSGLSDGDPRRFGSVGLRSLVKDAAAALQQASRRFPGDQQVINATGGYKAEISFAGLIGQALKVPVVYLFESFPSCIEMPPMPVHFDRDLWARHYPLFAGLSEAGQMGTEELNLQAVDPAISSLLEHEEIDGQQYVALTPVLELMHQSFIVHSPPVKTAPPEAGVTPAERLGAMTTVGHHKLTGEEALLARLAALPWVRRIQSIRMGNHKHSAVAPGLSSEVSEIWLWYAKGSVSKLFLLGTTCEDAGQWMYCMEELERVLA